MTRPEASQGSHKGLSSAKPLWRPSRSSSPSSPTSRSLISRCDIVYRTPEITAGKTNLHVRSSTGMPHTLVFYLPRRHNPYEFQRELSSSVLAHTFLYELPADPGFRRVDISFLEGGESQFEALKCQGGFAFGGVFYKAVVPVSDMSNSILKLSLKHLPQHFSSTHLLSLFGPYGTVLEVGRYYNECGMGEGKDVIRAYTGFGYLFLQRPFGKDTPQEPIPASFDIQQDVRLLARVVPPKLTDRDQSHQRQPQKHQQEQQEQQQPSASSSPAGGNRKRNNRGKRKQQRSLAVEDVGTTGTNSNSSSTAAIAANIPSTICSEIVATNREQEQEREEEEGERDQEKEDGEKEQDWKKKDKVGEQDWRRKEDEEGDQDWETEDEEEGASEYEDASETFSEIEPPNYSKLFPTSEAPRQEQCQEAEDEDEDKEETEPSEHKGALTKLPESKHLIVSSPSQEQYTSTVTASRAIIGSAKAITTAAAATTTAAAAVVIAAIAGVVAAAGGLIWLATLAHSNAYKGKAKVIEAWHGREPRVLAQILLLLFCVSFFICFCFLFSFVAIFGLLLGFSEITIDIIP